MSLGSPLAVRLDSATIYLLRQRGLEALPFQDRRVVRSRPRAGLEFEDDEIRAFAGRWDEETVRRLARFGAEASRSGHSDGAFEVGGRAYASATLRAAPGSKGTVQQFIDLSTGRRWSIGQPVRVMDGSRDGHVLLRRANRLFVSTLDRLDGGRALPFDGSGCVTARFVGDGVVAGNADGTVWRIGRSRSRIVVRRPRSIPVMAETASRTHALVMFFPSTKSNLPNVPASVYAVEAGQSGRWRIHRRWTGAHLRDAAIDPSGAHVAVITGEGGVLILRNDVRG